jgi:hypothetical protein
VETLINLEAEQALLGAVLTDNRVLDRVEFLSPEHFADALHGRLQRPPALGLVRAPDGETARGVLTQGQYADVEVHAWEFGGRR